MGVFDTEMTEKDLQALVVGAADAGGWLVYHTHDSRRSPAGFPDLVLVRGTEVLFVELKSERGRVRPDQQVWMDALDRVDTISNGIVRPSQADQLVGRLMAPEKEPTT